MDNFQIGDWVYADDWCYGQIVDIEDSIAVVEFETWCGGGSIPFSISDLEKAPNPSEGRAASSKQQIYDELCSVITRYEESCDDESELMYEMLVKIQNNWEDIITAD